ncbi:MAG: hypothetical protein ACRELX_04735, partial [Longimicrobiales bacterium]
MTTTTPASPRLPPLVRRWKPRAAECAGTAALLERTLHLPPSLCRLLVLRGHREPAAARDFLKPRLD